MKKTELLSIVAVVFLIIMRLTTLAPGCDNSHDSFYHVTMADLGPSFYMSKKLPSLTLSYWSENYSDKELSFHMLLSGIRKTMDLLGQPTGAPFHFEYILFACLLIMSFVLVARHFKIEKIYLYAMALVVIAPFFTTRLVLLRPHLLALSIVLLSCILFDIIDKWQKIWIPFLLGFIMAWSYSNPHFILLPAVAFALIRIKGNWKLAMAIPASTILGIIIGFTLHPQFPNTFINWKIQCIDVMMISLNRASPVKLGYELCPGNFNFFVEHWMLFILLIFNSGLLLCYIKSRKLINTDKRLIAMYLMSLISYLGIFVAVRAVEYAVPFALLATGMLVHEYNIHQTLKLSKKVKRAFFATAVVLVLIVLSAGGINYYKRARHLKTKPFMHFSEWLSKSKIPPGSIIGNINWSDFPLLFYAAPNYRYLAGVDPMFAYFKTPAKMKEIELFRTGRKFLDPDQLYNATGTRFIFVSYYNRKLAGDMFKKGYVSVYQGEDGNLFDLKLSLENMKKIRSEQ